MVNDWIPMLISPLSRNFGIFIILVGLYSLIFNTKEAKRQNHKRDEQVSRIGGWCYIILGIAVVIFAKVS